jgi:hypothetical protein
MALQTLQDATEALRPYVPLVGLLTGKDTTLERIVPFMKLIGNLNFLLYCRVTGS